MIHVKIINKGNQKVFSMVTAIKEDHRVLISSIRVLQDQDIKDLRDLEIKFHQQVKDQCLSMEVPIKEAMMGIKRLVNHLIITNNARVVKTIL